MQMQRKWRSASVIGVAILLGLSSARPREVSGGIPWDGQPAVIVSAKILEVPLGTFPHAPRGNREASVISAKALSETLSELSSRANVVVLSAPQVMTYLGNEAVIAVGQEMTLPPGKGPQTQFLGLKLTVKPKQANGKIELETTASQTFLKDDPTPAGQDPEFHQEEASAKVALGLGDQVMLAPMPAKTAGREVVVFLEVAYLPALAREEFPAAAAPSRAATIILPRLDFRGATLEEGIDWLRQKSRSLDPTRQGINFVVYAPPAESPALYLDLTDFTILNAARAVAALAGLEFHQEEYALVLSPPSTVLPARPRSEDSEALLKAETLLLPKLEFRHARLAEALEFIRERSKTLDLAKSGVNIVLKAGAGRPDLRIDLSLNEVPVSEGLRYVAGLAGLVVVAERNALILTEPAP